MLPLIPLTQILLLLSFQQMLPFLVKQRGEAKAEKPGQWLRLHRSPLVPGLGLKGNRVRELGQELISKHAAHWLQGMMSPTCA